MSGLCGCFKVRRKQKFIPILLVGGFSFVLFLFLVIFMGIEGCGVEKRESVWEEDIFSKVVREFYFPLWPPGYFSFPPSSWSL